MLGEGWEGIGDSLVNRKIYKLENLIRRQGEKESLYSPAWRCILFKHNLHPAFPKDFYFFHMEIQPRVC
jgi:hypothetical protein